MSDSEQYTVDLRANTRNYQQGIDASASSTDALLASVTRLGTGLANLYQRADRKLTLIAAGEAAAITAVTVAAGRLDQQMSQLQARQVMLGRETNAYDGTVRKLRTGLGLTATDTIGLVTQLNRLNVPMSQQQKAVETYVRLSATTGESVQGLTQSTTMFMRQMGNTQPVERYASALATLHNEYGASAQGTADFANQIAPLSKTLGMNSQEILGISAAFSKAGQDGSQAGNVYTKILSDVNRAAQYGSPELQVYSDLIGTSVDRLKAMPKAEVVTEIFDALNKEGPQAIKTLERLGLDGVRSQRAIQSVIQQGGLREGIAAAQGGFGNTDKFKAGSQEALNGLNDQAARMSETSKAFAQSVGGVFLPAADKLFAGLNMGLAPVRAMTDGLNGLSGTSKGLLTAAAAIGVLLPLLPKFVALAAGTSLLPTLAKGSFGQGFGMGRRPDRELRRADETYMAGGGTAGTRTLYRAGMYAGDFFNRGQGGDLRDRTFLDPEGNERGLRSMHGLASDAAVKYGLMRPEDVGAPRTGTGAATRGINRTVGFAGDLFRAQLNPWRPGYQRDAVGVNNPDAITQQSRWRDTAPMQALSKMFSREGLDENVDAMREHREKIKGEGRKWETDGADVRRQFRNNASVLGNVMKEVALTGGATARAGAGMAYGGAALGARGVAAAGRGVGRFAMEGAGGPVGAALLAGAGAAYLYSSNRSSMREGIKGDEGDSSAGAEYRNAMGIASKATRSFADVVADSATRLNTTVSTVQQAITVTAEDVRKAAGQTSQIVDKNIVGMDAQQATSYAQAMLPGADPREAQGLKYDLIARFGGTQAQTILNAGSDKNQMGGLFGLVGSRDQEILGGRAANDLTMSDRTKAGIQTIADTAKNQMGTVYDREGDKGAGRYSQSLINDFLSTTTRDADTGPANRRSRTLEMDYMKGGSQTTRARYAALAQSLGLSENDRESQTALNNVLQEVQGRDTKGMSAQAQEAMFQELLTKNLEGTDLGAKLADARQRGGVYSGTNYITQGMGAPTGFEPINGQLDQLRGTSVGRTATSYTQGSGTTFARAINNEGNADYQSIAVRDLVSKTNTDQGGDWRATAAALVEFKNNAGAASGQVSQLADAAMAAAAAQRSYASQMEGQTTLVDRMSSANFDYKTAQDAYRKAPDAPGAYQRVEDTRSAVEATNVEATQRLNSIATQYRNLDIQRQQGVEQLAYSEERALEDYYRQAAWGQQDFDRSRARSSEQFHLSESRATEDFTRQRKQGEADFQRQQSRGISDYNLSRRRSEEDFSRSRRRSESDFNLSLRRSQSDFTRSRVRQEEDYNHQVQLMARQSAKSIYDIYNRVTVQRTWSGENLLQNFADQQKKISEQQANLEQARKMGLSNAAISMMGLNEAGNAQQLDRLVADMMADPKLAARFNSGVKDRTKGAGALMKDPANEQWTEMERNRKLGLERAQEDFNLSVERQRKDFARSLERQRKDYKLSSDRQADDFELSLERSNDDFALGMRRSARDFNRQLGRNREDFATQMSNASEDYNIMRARQRKQMDIGFANMRRDFARQMKIANDNVSTYAEEIALSFDKAFGIVHGRTEGKTRRQIEEMGKLLGTYKTETNKAGGELDKSIRAPYDKLNIYKPFQLVKGGPQMSIGGPGSEADVHQALHAGEGIGGPSAAMASSPSPTTATSGGTGEKTNPLSGSLHVNTPYGKKGSWAAGYHTGVDLKGTTGTPLYAVAPGRIVYAGGGGAYGNLTKIDHGKNSSGQKVQTWYAHQSSQQVRAGDEVKRGERIGAVGHTGRVFPAGPGGAHLHFELRVDGKDRDPMPWLRGASTVTGKGGAASDSGGGLSMPNWAQLAGVKKWNAQMEKLGLFDRGSAGLKPATMPNMLAWDYGNKAIDKYGSSAFEDGGSLGSTGSFTAPKAGQYGGSKFSSEQLRNAAIIASVAGSERAAKIGIITALQESTLRNLGYGDRDSVGLFQQRAPWGSRADRMDPRESAKMFFNGGQGGQRGLFDISGWQGMSMGAASQKVQVSAYPGAYTKWIDEAEDIWDALGRSTGGGGGKKATGGKGKVKWKGGTFTELFANVLKKAEKEAGSSFTVSQGGWNPGGVKASGKSHWGDAVDLWWKSTGERDVKALRANKVAAWHRTPAQGFSHHIHGVPLPGAGYPGGSAVWQGQDYLRGGNGLARGGVGSGWTLVGEEGPELRFLGPATKVKNTTESMRAIIQSKASQVVPTQSSNVTNYTYDQRVTYEKVEVKANDTRQFEREMEAKARLANLTGPRSNR